jgi:hypothetical protein
MNSRENFNEVTSRPRIVQNRYQTRKSPQSSPYQILCKSRFLLEWRILQPPKKLTRFWLESWGVSMYPFVAAWIYRLVECTMLRSTFKYGNFHVKKVAMILLTWWPSRLFTCLRMSIHPRSIMLQKNVPDFYNSFQQNDRINGCSSWCGLKTTFPFRTLRWGLSPTYLNEVKVMTECSKFFSIQHLLMMRKKNHITLYCVFKELFTVYYGVSRAVCATAQYCWDG